MYFSIYLNLYADLDSLILFFKVVFNLKFVGVHLI